MSDCAPVVVVAFNRPHMVRETLLNLSRCEEVDSHEVYLVIDGPRSDADREKINQVVVAANSFRSNGIPNLQVVARDANLGGVPNMRRTLDECLERYGRVIVIEDDILVSRTFLRYMEDGLRKFENDKRVWAINGYLDWKMAIPRSYPYDCFMAPRHSAWGWATWKDRWQAVDFELKDWPESADDVLLKELSLCGGDIRAMLDAQKSGKLNAWDVQCTYYMRKNGMYTIRPRVSMTKNNGFGTECEHCSQPSSTYSKQKYYNLQPDFDVDLFPDENVLRAFRRSFSRPLVERVRDRILRFYLDYLGSTNREPLEIK